MLVVCIKHWKLINVLISNYFPKLHPLHVQNIFLKAGVTIFKNLNTCCALCKSLRYPCAQLSQVRCVGRRVQVETTEMRLLLYDLDLCNVTCNLAELAFSFKFVPNLCNHTGFVYILEKSVNLICEDSQKIGFLFPERFVFSEAGTHTHTHSYSINFQPFETREKMIHW
jgi:hypothetical protein